MTNTNHNSYSNLNMGGGNSMESFIEYCDKMMIANEKFSDIFKDKELEEINQRIKNGETAFKCTCNIDGHDVLCAVDISNYKKKNRFTGTIMRGWIRSLVNNKKYIQKALNQKFMDTTGMFWSKKGDRVKDMSYYWKEIRLTVGKRDAIEVDGTLHFENIGRDVKYGEIRSLVDKYIADMERNTAIAAGVVTGYSVNY